MRIFFNALLLFFIFSTECFGQKNYFDTVNGIFNSYRQNSIQEKIYLHTDRKTYLTGETLWFKAYLVDGTFHLPLNMSKVVYVELLDQSNQPVLQTRIEMGNGRGSGSLFLPATLHSGNFILRSYTSWMKNFDPAFYFHSAITLINPFVKPEPSAIPNSANINLDAQFFPEGGNLVDGIKSKVAFRVTDRTGKGIDFKGTIIDDNNNVVTTFKPDRFGIGYFYLTPKVQKKYKAILEDSPGVVSTFELPDVQQNGFVIELTEVNNQIEISVETKAISENDSAYLFIHARQNIYYQEKRIITNHRSKFVIKKNNLPDGISHITLFNSSLLPVSERLYFKKPTTQLPIELSGLEATYEKRKKVTLKLQTPTEANLSLSVYKLDSLPFIQNERIIDYLWLTSDLKGSIESPEFYFSQDSLASKAADNLMLTHGWRRFKWNSLSEPQNFIPEHHGHIINGNITDQNGNPAAGILTYLSYPGKLGRVYVCRSDSQGRLFFEVEERGGQRIIVQTNSQVDSLYKIKLNQSFSQQFSSYSTPPYSISPTAEKNLLDRTVALQAQSIYHGEHLDKPIVHKKDSFLFYGKADETYFLDKYTRFPVMEEVLREYVRGVLVRKKKEEFHLKVLDQVNKIFFQDDPLILLDGVPIFNVNKIMNFDPLKIERLEVMDKKYYLGSGSFSGLVSYVTYNGDLPEYVFDRGALSLNYEGLQEEREFYSPRYENTTEESSRLPDLRTLLYWNPTITLKKDSFQEIKFYTSDQPGEYQLILKGISTDGKAADYSYHFSVKK